MFTSFAFPFTNFFQPGIFWPSLAAFRPLQIIAALALLASLGRASDYPRTDVLRHPALKWLLFFLFVQAISVYRSGLAAMLEESGFWLSYVLFLLVSVRIVTSSEALRRYIWGMLCGSMWIVGYGIYAVLTGLMDIPNGGRAGAYGMYENHNDYSFIIVQIVPFLYVYRRDSTSFLRRFVLLAAIVTCLVGIALSLSRGGMMALVLEVLLIVVFTTTGRTRLYLIPLVLVLGAGAVTFQYIKRAQNQGDSYTAEDAETSRQELWNAGGAMFKEHPILGVGSRKFGEYATSYAEISHDNLGKNAHNTYIEAAATTGLLGLISFVMALFRAQRELREPAQGRLTAWEESTRKATLIALYTICFRAMFDAKSWDWSFYVLITISAILGAMMRSRPVAAIAPAPAAVDLVPWSNRLPEPGSPRRD